MGGKRGTERGSEGKGRLGWGGRVGGSGGRAEGTGERDGGEKRSQRNKQGGGRERCLLKTSVHNTKCQGL